MEGSEAVIGTVLAHDLGRRGGRQGPADHAARGAADVFTVSGIFDLGNKDVNQRWVLVSLRQAQTLLDLAGGITTIEVKVDEIFEAERDGAGALRRSPAWPPTAG